MVHRRENFGVPVFQFFGNPEMKIIGFNLTQINFVDLHQHPDDRQQQCLGKEHLDELPLEAFPDMIDER